MLFLCGRQNGKSVVAAALALATLLLTPRSLVLLLSPTLRQSSELFRKLLALYRALARPVAATRETGSELELANGSRVVSLPENETGIRCFSGVALLIIDEASRVGDDLYFAVRPMLAVSDGSLLALSTPFGARGWFWRAWEEGAGWERHRARSDRCPRISAAFLAEERAVLGERWYAAEHELEFVDPVGAVFPADLIRAAVSDEVKPLWR
jgi:hypothetical protein